MPAIKCLGQNGPSLRPKLQDLRVLGNFLARGQPQIKVWDFDRFGLNEVCAEDFRQAIVFSHAPVFVGHRGKMSR